MANDRSPTFSAFCESLGAPLYNVRWSWAAYSSSNCRSVFTLWEDELIDGRYVFLSPADLALPKHGGRTELRQIFDQTLETGALAIGIKCTAKDVMQRPRTRLRFDSRQLLLLKLVRENEERVAYQAGYCSPALLEPKTQSAVRSAINDLDDEGIGTDQPPRVNVGATRYVRNDEVRKFVRQRAKGKCEHCGQEGFETPGGEKYIETHHIIHLARQGADTPRNVIGLCASHHREAHYGAHRASLEKEFLRILRK